MPFRFRDDPQLLPSISFLYPYMLLVLLLSPLILLAVMLLTLRKLQLPHSPFHYGFPFKRLVQQPYLLLKLVGQHVLRLFLFITQLFDLTFNELTFFPCSDSIVLFVVFATFHCSFAVEDVVLHWALIYCAIAPDPSAILVFDSVFENAFINGSSSYSQI